MNPSVPDPSSTSSPIIVIGSGPVGVAFVQKLKARLPGVRVKLFGAEEAPAYDRIRLSELLAGKSSVASLSQDISLDDVECFFHCAIVAIDPESRHVVDQNNQIHPYSRLIIATGSRPYRPSIPGVDLKRVYTFRDLRDTEHLVARRAASQHTVVVGGGLLGLEAAAAMARLNTRVSVVQQASHLMNRQLDEKAASLLEASLRKRVSEVYTGSGVREIQPASQAAHTVGGVVLRNGHVIACDTVIIAAGIEPNTDLAKASGIAVGRGIKVNTRLETSVAGIYAIGECAEFAGQLYGLVAPGIEQAGVLAAAIAGQEVAYLGSLSASKLKVAGESVFSAGEIHSDETTLPLQSAEYCDPEKSLYRKLLVSRGQLVGALGYGEWEETPRLQSAISEQRRVFFWQLWRFQKTGSLWPQVERTQVASWPASARVCNCRGVTRGDLSRAIQGGCQTVTEITQATGAAGVCGSCEPLLHNLLGEPERPSFSGGSTALALLAALASALLVGFMQIDFQPSSSIQSLPWWERLWSHSDYKQYTGFTLLGLLALGLLVSLKKRLLPERLRGHFSYWRLWHVFSGVTALLLLGLHTGFELGDNLNRWLILNFLALSALGAVVGLVVSFEAKLPARLGKQARHWSQWAHLLVSWPLPALLSFHILSVYYF